MTIKKFIEEANAETYLTMYRAGYFTEQGHKAHLKYVDKVNVVLDEVCNKRT